MEKKIRLMIECDTQDEVEQLRRGLEQPDIRVLVRIVGTLLPMSSYQRRRVMEQVVAHFK